MTERKPAGVDFETWVDAQVRAGQENGAFDNLPGTGKPIPGIGEPYDDDWWVKPKIRDEGLSAEALLPTPLRLLKEIERLDDTVGDLPAERMVREVVAELNERIVAWQRSPTPPHRPLRRVDADEVVRRWRAAGPSVAQPSAPAEERKVSWWRRVTGRSR